MSGFYEIPIPRDHELLSDELAAVIPLDLQEEFIDLVYHVFMTSAATWYSGMEGETYKELIKVLKIVELDPIPLPDLQVYKNTVGHDSEHWGRKLTQEEINQWKAAT